MERIAAVVKDDMLEGIVAITGGRCGDCVDYERCWEDSW